MKIFVTGGAGFIGSSLVKAAIARGFHVVNIDKLTYAGNLESLASVASKTLYEFEHLDICDISSVNKLFAKHKPDGVFHLAAESHVDRSIDGPAAFVNTNVIGTFNLLEAARSYVAETKSQDRFRFIHVSTDEVFGSLGDTEYFSESTPYRPNSPYAASKAASDHFARAWSHTYSLPVIVTNCSNNFGPYQFPEKLIPLLVLNALEGKKLPIYGSGKNIRDWIYVEDHVSALLRVFERGKLGSTYNIGSQNERQNIDVAKEICAILDEILPLNDKSSYSKLITHVEDRPGHDFRYAIDSKKMVTELEWRPVETFESGLRKTVQWYIENRLGWCGRVQSGEYQRERLGLIPN